MRKSSSEVKIQRIEKQSLDRDAGTEAQPSGRVLTFVLPMPENLANARMHWRVKYEKLREYYQQCDVLQMRGLLPPTPDRPFVRASISAVLYLGAAMDEGNAMHRAEKWPCDWLKTRGYIVDDSKKHLTWTGIPMQRVKRGQTYRIELTLTEQP